MGPTDINPKIKFLVFTRESLNFGPSSTTSTNRNEQVSAYEGIAHSAEPETFRDTQKRRAREGMKKGWKDRKRNRKPWE